MADTSKKSGKNKVQSIGTAVEDPPEQTESPISKKGKAKPDPIGKHESFFARIARIARDDWGTRAKIKVYRLEPIIDRLRGSENKYITIYHEPITEEKLKIDHGSGRYRLYLNFKEPAGSDKEIDAIEVDIMDLNFPPKVPPGEWVEDARNKKWAWAKPGGPGSVVPAPPQPMENAYETVLGIQDRERERLEGKGDDISKFTAMAEAVKTLMPTPAPATDNTMLSTIVTLMTKQSENTQQLMTAQLAASQQETQQLRQQVFQLIQAKAQEKGNSAVDVVKEIINEAETLFPKIKGLFSSFTEGATTVVHGRARPWWQDILVQTVPDLSRSVAPILTGVATRMMTNPAAQLPALPAANGAPQPNPAQQSPVNQAAAQLMNFLSTPRVLQKCQQYFTDFVSGKQDQGVPVDGEDFAYWIYDAWGPEPIQWARMVGLGNILALMKQQPYWVQIQPHEAKMVEFMEQVLRSEPPEEDQPQDENETDLTVQMSAAQGD